MCSSDLGTYLLLVVFHYADGSEVSRELFFSGARSNSRDVNHVCVWELESHGIRIIRLQKVQEQSYMVHAL